MFAEPAGFDRDELARTLRAGWGIEAVELRYEPVGFGTHHYRVRAGDGADWFVNVDEVAAKPWLGTGDAEVIGGLERALGTAAALREAGLEFVHAPHRHADGSCVTAMTGGYAVSVFGFIEGSSHVFGDFPSHRERRTVLAALGRMHAATAAVPADLPVRDSLAVPYWQAFLDASRQVRTRWTGGPYAEPARELIRERAGVVADLFARYDALVPVVRSTSDGWVVTHGEPHAGNVMTTDEGIALIDWDTAALAPRERDLWLAEPRTGEDWLAYGGATRADPAAMELYRLRWRLTDICAFVATLRAPHADDENTRIAWRELRNYLTSALPGRPATG